MELHHPLDPLPEPLTMPLFLVFRVEIVSVSLYAGVSDGPNNELRTCGGTIRGVS